MNTTTKLDATEIMTRYISLLDAYPGAHVEPASTRVAMDEVWIISGAEDAHLVGFLYYDDMETAWDIHCAIADDTIFSTSLLERGPEGNWQPAFDFG